MTENFGPSLAALGLLAACNDPGALTINNTDPSAVIDAPIEAAVLSAGMPLTLEGTVGDAETPEAELIVQWRVNDEVVCEDPPDAFGETTCETALPSGEVSIRLQVADGSGGLAEDSITVSASRCFDDDDVLAEPSYTQALGNLDQDDLTVDGQLQDNFQFDGVAGDQLALHGWSEDFDPQIEVYDSSCERIASDADGGRGTNAFLTLRVPEDGSYTAVIRTTAGGMGDYVLEVLDDSVEVGSACSLGSSSLDLWSSPYTDTATGELTTNDQTFPPGVGQDFYYDDVETWLLYGDRLDVVLTSSAFTPALSLFAYNHTAGGCGLLTYDGNDDADGTAAAGVDIVQSGIYVPVAWARFSGATGAWSMDATATF